jgi:hypothetical protein
MNRRRRRYEPDRVAHHGRAGGPELVAASVVPALYPWFDLDLNPKRELGGRAVVASVCMALPGIRRRPEAPPAGGPQNRGRRSGRRRRAEMLLPLPGSTGGETAGQKRREAFPAGAAAGPS